jgi:Co/Zn/Cd efflux system component
MAGCCESDCEISSGSERQRKTLWIVLWINALMFLVLVAGSFLGKTVSLFADSFDNLGDAFTYAISIWAIGKSQTFKAKVAFLKGVMILMGALAVLVGLLFKWIYLDVPESSVMGGLAILSLFANLLCLLLLWRHRNEDINMESVWHCSRNDLMTNASVILASVLVWYFDSWIPDVALGLLLFVFLLRSGVFILKKYRSELDKT